MRLVAEMKKVWESKARAEKKVLMADEILGSIILVKATEKRLTITAAPRSDEKQTRRKERKMKENGKRQKKTKTRGTKESNEKSVTRVCSVLGVGNGRERITVEPFLQIMTPSPKEHRVQTCKHLHPTLKKEISWCRFSIEEIAFLQRQNGGYVRSCLILLVANPNIWPISMKKMLLAERHFFCFPTAIIQQATLFI